MENPKELPPCASFTILKNLLEKVEAMPTLRHFDEAYSVSLLILEFLGNRDFNGFGIKNTLSKIDADSKNCWYMKYSRAFIKPIDSLLISRVSGKERNIVELQRKKGHMIRQEESQYDLPERVIRYLAHSDIRQEYRDMQPYRVKVGTSMRNLQIVHEF